MSNVALIGAKLQFLAQLDPRRWEAGHPQVPFPISDAHVDLLVADTVKLVAGQLTDKGLAERTLELSREMGKAAMAALVNAWDPGDELCPPWRRPIPWPGPWPWSEVSEPDPEPWEPIAAATQVQLAFVLTNLAAITTSERFNASLKSLSVGLARNAGTRLVDDFERCGNQPRKPFPPRR